MSGNPGANIILESPKDNANDNNCLSTYESLASWLFNGSDLNPFSKYKKLKNKHYTFCYSFNSCFFFFQNVLF